MDYFVRGPFDLARELGHHWCGEEHILLDALAARPLLGLTHTEARDAVLALVARDGPPIPDDHHGHCMSAPSYHDFLGRVIGFALGTGADRPGPGHVWAALAWDPAGITATLLADRGHSRREVLDAAGPLGRLVPEAPAANPLPAPTEQEAVALGHGFHGHDHLLLALLAGKPDDRAGRLLRQAGLGHDVMAARLSAMLERTEPPLPPPVDPAHAPPNPRVRQVFGSAEGLAATLGDGVVTSTDGLVAYLWQDDGQQLLAIEDEGSSAPALVAALEETGVRVPSMPLPEPDRAPWGEKVRVPKDRVAEVVALVRSRHPSSTRCLTCIGGPGWVLAKADVDLPAIVAEVLAIPPSGPPPTAPSDASTTSSSGVRGVG